MELWVVDGQSNKSHQSGQWHPSSPAAIQRIRLWPMTKACSFLDAVPWNRSSSNGMKYSAGTLSPFCLKLLWAPNLWGLVMRNITPGLRCGFISSLWYRPARNYRENSFLSSTTAAVSMSHITVVVAQTCCIFTMYSIKSLRLLLCKAGLMTFSECHKIQWVLCVYCLANNIGPVDGSQHFYFWMSRYLHRRMCPMQLPSLISWTINE